MKKNKPKAKTSKCPPVSIVVDMNSLRAGSINQISNDQMTAAVGTRYATGKPMEVFIGPNLERDKELDRIVSDLNPDWTDKKPKTLLDKIKDFFLS